MNIVTGSSGGLGKFVYDEFKKLNLPVLGLDKVGSPTTDFIVDLSEAKKIRNLSKKINSKIDSITFTHAIGNSQKEVENYSLNQYSYINAESNLDFLEEFSKSLEETSSVIFISSIHSKATNKQSGSYAVSKQYLESIYRQLCLDNSNYIFNKCLLRIGAMDTKMLSNNVDDLSKLADEIPSKKIIRPQSLANLITNIHLNHNNLLNCSILQIDGGVLFKLGTD